MEAKNIYEALAAIMEELPGIGKDQKASAQQGGYAYRGIEAITRALQPLLAKYKVVPTATVVSWERDNIVVNSKPWTDDRLWIEYRFTHGPSETAVVVTVPGIGRDNSDKGSNKAMTQAYKYALLQTFCIADGKDDNDGTTDVADAPQPRLSAEQNAQLQTLMLELDMSKDQMLDFASETLGRSIKGAGDLTPEEGTRLITELESKQQVEPEAG